MTKRVESLRAPCLDASSTLATSTNTKSGKMPLFVFVEVGSVGQLVAPWVTCLRVAVGCCRKSLSLSDDCL